MSSSEVRYRRPLNSDQLIVIGLLFRFRFGTTEYFAWRFNKPSGKHIQKRLNILEQQGYIAKHYDKSYKLQGKPAAYYLLPKAAKLLQTKYPDGVTDQAIKNRYKDKDASEQFITHSLAIVDVYRQLRILYDTRLTMYAKIDLSLDQFCYFPKWLPDAFVTLKGGAKGSGKERQFFLDVFEETTPFFVLIRRIKSYLTYAQSDLWESETDTPLPAILMVCETEGTQKRLRRRIKKELDELWDDELATFYTTTKQELADSNQQADKIWQLAIDTKVVRSMKLM